MFDPVITLPFVGGKSVSIIDTDDGKTTRSINLGGGNRLDLIIQRAESTENKGILSDRYNVRIDRILTEATTPYAPTKVSVYLVCVVPRRPDVTIQVVADLYNALTVLMYGGDDVDSGSLPYGTGSRFAQLLSGET
jgi:hypothetical protein